jgi:hypothetical protein
MMSLTTNPAVPNVVPLPFALGNVQFYGLLTSFAFDVAKLLPSDNFNYLLKRVSVNFGMSTNNTILWNGPMGVFEMSSFESGTKAVAEAIVDATINGSYSLIGGGDSVAAINKYHFAERVSYVSTGGGALLEYIENGSLPGVRAIEE